jgi:A/G-specific adenine glycosylase
VGSLGHGLAVPLVETNVRRVLSRAALGEEPGDAPPKLIDETAAAWLDREHPAEWNQALMDLGRDVCRPAPLCRACPLRPGCRSGGRDRRGLRTTVRQASFEGSFRQVRGRVIAALSERTDMTLTGLARLTGEPDDRIAQAVAALHTDCLVHAGPSALRGAPRGRVRLTS